MKSNEERIELMHKKAEKLRHKRNKRLMAVSASICALLFAILIAASVGIETQVAGTAETTFAASSLFSASIGGYVMVAVIAFMIGVAITVILKKHIESKRNERESCK